jgi:predicted N-acetyltransferase YhbS
VADGDVIVRALEERDLPAADRVFRLAFGTRVGLPDPSRFAEGAELVRSRFALTPEAAFVAETAGEIVGSAFLTRWGSFAVFGPLSVHPDHADRGVGQSLWAAVLPVLDAWGVTHTSLYTMPDSTKHVHLYQKLGFWPHYLTALTELEVPRSRGAAAERCSLLPEAERAAIVEGCRVLVDAIHPGLDLGCEIRLVVERGRGETVIVGDTEGLAGFAVCHGGPGSEAVPGTCYVKFAAARPGVGAANRFEQVLDAVEEHAATAGFSRVEAGVNLARRDAHRALAARGYRTFTLGVAMHRPDTDAFDRPDAFVLDDRR